MFTDPTARSIDQTTLGRTEQRRIGDGRDGEARQESATAVQSSSRAEAEEAGGYEKERNECSGARQSDERGSRRTGGGRR